MDQDLTSYPVDHLSFSALTLFLRNRFLFKKRYILKLYDDKSSPASIVGRAGHKALQTWYEHGDADRAMQAGHELIAKIKDDWIEFGKTGSREQILKDFAQAFNFYIAEVPAPDKILGIEKSITAFIDIGDGQQLALPAKSVSDLIIEKNGGVIHIIDHKFVKSYTDSETDKAMYMLQAIFNYHTVKKEFGKAPASMIFNECKVTKNKDGSDQVQPYVVDFSRHKEYFNVFNALYNQVTEEISNPNTQYLPNFADYDADETFKDYVAGIITVESPVTQHKTADRQYTDRKFVSSKVDIVDNEHLTAEEKIRVKLQEFGLPVEMAETFVGASVIQYTFKPSRGTSMKQFESREKDLAIALQAKYIRVQAPIMGTNLVGVEVPNPNRSIINYQYNEDNDGTLNIPIGVDVYGHAVIKSLADMPHLLIAGATGSGKSVMINVAIKALTDQNGPEALKMVLIDPKRVELSQFKNIPHLLAPVIFDELQAAKTMNWLVEEMEIRYTKLEKSGYRNIEQYNADQLEKMPRIVVVVDEFADLIMQSVDSEEVSGMSSERAIVRLAQKARAIGIHLIIGTQRPSVDVVTGLIKANFSCRIAYATASSVDSKVILDEVGAEQLIGKGDCLFLDPHERQIKRLQSYLI